MRHRTAAGVEQAPATPGAARHAENTALLLHGGGSKLSFGPHCPPTVVGRGKVPAHAGGSLLQKLEHSSTAPVCGQRVWLSGMQLLPCPGMAPTVFPATCNGPHHSVPELAFACSTTGKLKWGPKSFTALHPTHQHPVST